MKIEFTYSQALPTAHPLFTVTVVFEVEADVDGDSVKLLNLWAHTKTGDKHGSTAWISIPLPDRSTKKGETCLLTLSQKAREAAKQWQAENF